MFVSIKEYAKQKGLGEAFIRSLVASGQLPSIMVGKRKRKINVEEADKTLKTIKSLDQLPKQKLSFKERLAELRAGCA